MKRILILLFGICLMCSGCGKKNENESIDTLKEINSRGRIIVGVKTDTKPFGFYDKNGNLTGFDVELSKIIAKSLLGNERKIEFVPVTPSNRLMKLEAKEVDILVATMSITEQRELIVNFSTPYYMAGQAILVNNNSDINSLKQLANKRIIIVFGSTSEKSIRTSVPNAVILGYKTYPQAFRALKAGKADAMIADDTILMNFALSDKSVKVLPKRYSQEPYAIAFRKSEETKTLETKLDIIISTMISSGQMEELQKKWGIYR